MSVIWHIRRVKFCHKWTLYSGRHVVDRSDSVDSLRENVRDFAYDHYRKFAEETILKLHLSNGMFTYEYPEISIRRRLAQHI